eukprot:gnl/Spiro4/27288_TR13581_c0_g1_i1.p1 gnl/Spiro4/27288_TR13581_c0_g1~~gnl/Spiro4/27288_TR13581_c0_g1_i1.p1  ORF type:complete len:232 (-),score=28.83 gnl/Spiro4/27288_TR13581_c0_g1_i1:62-757(-)
MSTGDELLECGDAPVFGSIYDSNRPMLGAALRAAGALVLDLGIVRDQAAHLATTINNAIELADLVVTSGGVSMGDLDLVGPTLETRGKVHFGRVMMKPGKPLTFATCGKTGVSGRSVPCFGLPGNPVSSLVCFHLAVLPALRQLLGRAPALTQIQVLLADRLKLDPERPEYHRAHAVWDHDRTLFVASSTGRQTSSRLPSMRLANVLCLLPRGSGFLEANSLVPAFVIGDL